MRSVKLNSATQYVPKYKEEELERGDKKDYWERPDRYLQQDTSYEKSPDHYAYITVRDGRFINPDKTWECMPVAYISETGMIKYLNEDVQTIKKLVINYGWGEPEKVPEARDIINEWAVERYQEWWDVRNRHSIKDQLWNITEVGGYVRPICWNRSEGMDVALAATHALNEGVDPAKVAHDYAIVMWCSNYVEKEGYEYPDCADIDVSYITKLVQNAFNKGWYANKNEGRTSYTSRFAPKEENEENAVNSSRNTISRSFNSSSNLMFGGLGNGLTVYDKSRRTGNLRLAGNDYLEVAHITTSGMIKYYADVNDEERTAICKRALLMQDEWLNTYGQDYGSTADAQRRLKEAQENAYNAGYEYPDNVAVNSSRLSAKTQRAIRHCINSARRRANLNCGVTRYAGDEEYQTYYFITEDNSFVASFDVEIHEDVIEFAGFMRGYSAKGYVVNENSVFGEFAPGTDIASALADFVYDKTGVTVYETEDAKEFVNQLRNINTIFMNSRRATLKANRRLNSGYYYDGEDYSEMGYDAEQDAYYDLPDEMYIYKLDLSQFTDLVRDGIVSKHEIHEWIDELSENWGGMPAWSPAKLLDRFEIQDLTKEQYDTWKANFATESARFADAVTRR